MADLVKAAHALLVTGPHKHEPSSRRIRVLLNDTYIFDTSSALLVWEHAYYPQYYLPLSALQNATVGPAEAIPALSSSATPTGDATTQSDYTLHSLTANGKHTPGPALLAIHAGPLKDYARLSPHQMDAWFEEDDVIRSHPTDPYKRIDVRRSSRPIRVEVGGVEVATASWAVHLFETGLPRRFYLPRTSVKWELLRESKTKSYCTYKGWANYFDVVADGETWKDIVWWYETPLLEVAAVKDLVCFYNEKVDVWLDGEKLEKAKSHFA